MKGFKPTYLLLLLSILASSILSGQGFHKPKPHMGAHIIPEFTNLWNMLNAYNGELYGSANMGNYAAGKLAMVYLAPDGWPRADKSHSLMVNLDTAVNLNLNVKVGDLFHCQYSGTSSQLTLASTDVVIENKVETDGLVTFDFKVLRLGKIYFNIDGRIADIQIMRPGYQLNDPRLVTDECKAYLRGLHVVKFTEQSGCNSSFERQWQYRTPANAPFENYVSNGDLYSIKRRQESCFDVRGSSPWLSNSFNQARSFPWEKAIDLCNYLNVDFYANVPVLADLDYIQELAKLVKLRLDPKLNIYIEIGNDVWRYQYEETYLGNAMLYPAMYDMVKLRGDYTIQGAPSKGITYENAVFGDGLWRNDVAGAHTAAKRWTAYRLKQFMDEFAKQFGFAEQGGVGARVRGVFVVAFRETTYGNEYIVIGDEGIDFLEKQFGLGTVKKYYYALGIPSYGDVNHRIAMGIEEMSRLSPVQIISQFNEATERRFDEFGRGYSCYYSADSSCGGNELEKFLALAKSYGLKLIANEGGPDGYVKKWPEIAPLKNILEAYNSPSMYSYIKNYMTKWYSWLGYDALFIKNGYYTNNCFGGGFSVGNKIGELSPQYKAYKDIMDSLAPPLLQERVGLLGVDRLSNIPGNKRASYKDYELRFTGSSVGVFLNYNKNILEWGDGVYIVRNETPTLYKVTFDYENKSVDGKEFEILLNDKLSNKIELPYNVNQHSRLSQSFLVEIPYGVHAFVVRAPLSATKAYYITLNNIEFELIDEVTSTPSKDQLLSKLAMVPNPANNNVTVIFPETDLEYIEISDMMGKTTLTEAIASGQSHYNLNISLLTKGMYMVQAKGKGGIYNGKLVVE